MGEFIMFNLMTNVSGRYPLPVYLESEVLNYFSAKAKAKGVELNSMVNDLLKKDMELIESRISN